MNKPEFYLAFGHDDAHRIFVEIDRCPDDIFKRSASRIEFDILKICYVLKHEIGEFFFAVLCRKQINVFRNTANICFITAIAAVNEFSYGF